MSAIPVERRVSIRCNVQVQACPAVQEKQDQVMTSMHSEVQVQRYKDDLFVPDTSDTSDYIHVHVLLLGVNPALSLHHYQCHCRT